MAKNFIQKFLLSALIATSVAGISNSAFAQETLTPEQQQKRDEMIAKWEKQRFSFSVSPVYVNQSRDNINSSFTNNGFAAPRQDFTGWDMRFKHQWDSRLQTGFEYFSAGTDRDLGTNLANFEQAAIGFYVGYQALRTEKVSLSVGSGIGGTWSKVEVFSQAQNGRVEEQSWYAQPAVQVAYQINEGFGLGLTAACMAPFAPSEKIVGTDLGSRDIAIQGFLGKVDLILGRF